MKKIATIIGCLLFLIGAFNVITYLSDYEVLAMYGKGFVWGNIILMSLGFLMAFIGLKKRG